MRILSTIIIFAGLLSACKREFTMFNTPSDVDFKEFQSYAFSPGMGSSDVEDEIIRFRSIEKVKEELDARGFILDLDSPDFIVRVHTFFNLRKDVTVNPDMKSMEGFGPKFYFKRGIPTLIKPAQEATDLEYAPGSIAIEALDVADGSLLWMARSKQPVPFEALPEDLESYIGRLFEGFPVNPN